MSRGRELSLLELCFLPGSRLDEVITSVVLYCFLSTVHIRLHDRDRDGAPADEATVDEAGRLSQLDSELHPSTVKPDTALPQHLQ